jgi:DNA-binding transcriptional regulator PaaX
MSSKSAAAKGSKDFLLELLNFVETGKWATIPSQKLSYLKRYDYITPKRGGYTLTRRGRSTLSERQIWALTIPTPKKWDRKWHIVLFDIPVDKKRRRDTFRLRLKELNFTLYQNSVWVHPYPIDATVTKIARFYKLERCILFVTAEKISGENSLRKKYDL